MTNTGVRTAKPVHRFAPNTPTVVNFPVGTAIESPSQYENNDGTRKIDYYYSISLDEGGGDDVEKSIYASAALHRELQQRGMGPNTTVQITKYVANDEQNREQTRWSVANSDGSERPLVTTSAQIAAQTPQAPQAAPQASIAPVAVATPAAAAASQSALLTFQAIAHHFRRCVQQAEKIYAEAGYTIDRAKPETLRAITAATSTLFIETNKKLDPAALMKEMPPLEYVPEPVAPVNPPPADIHPDGLPF
jgi:hypothetical protein